jgi:hypothetical protein
MFCDPDHAIRSSRLQIKSSDFRFPLLLALSCSAKTNAGRDERRTAPEILVHGEFTGRRPVIEPSSEAPSLRTTGLIELAFAQHPRGHGGNGLRTDERRECHAVRRAATPQIAG